MDLFHCSSSATVDSGSYASRILLQGLLENPNTYLDGLWPLHQMQSFKADGSSKTTLFSYANLLLISEPMAGCQRSPWANSLVLGLYF
jgi:hypothetical protein